ncbi:transcriptional regulatory protein DegU [mine drainage metagenome]|uniref:Transcriptional regulatory protein DegU n=1 Tax=mine drainage metagenome TaxID=410659 RepID=A0A1J5SGI6_9ZZZZ
MKFTSYENLDTVSSLMFASACKASTARYKEELSGIARMFHVNSFELLKEDLVQIEPEMLLLDFDLPKLNGVRGVSELRRLCPKTNIVVFHDHATDEDEWFLFKAGVRGCCPTNIEGSSLKMMVEAVSNGELWIRRKFLSRLLAQMEQRQVKEQAKHGDQHPDIHGLLAQLTDREYEIAVRIGNGESNKQIAYSLEITERTVKAHLTNIFEKLGVTDRLNVALMMSAEKRQGRNGSRVRKESNVVHLAVLSAQS